MIKNSRFFTGQTRQPTNKTNRDKSTTSLAYVAIPGRVVWTGDVTGAEELSGGSGRCGLTWATDRRRTTTFHRANCQTHQNIVIELFLFVVSTTAVAPLHALGNVCILYRYKKLIRRWDTRTWRRSILLPVLRLTPPTDGGVPWDDFRKILQRG